MAGMRKVRLITVKPTVVIMVILLLGAGALGIMELSPEARPVSLYYGHPLGGLVILIDPGHGGPDPGVHHNELITEKEVVLAVGLELRDLLEQAGAVVIMTREHDQDISHYLPDDPESRYRRDMKARVKLINESGADLFISIHINSVNDATVRGAIAFFKDTLPLNRMLAECVQKNINPVVYTNPQPGQLIHQNPKEGNYLVLNMAEIPGIIIEMAFMTSPDDRALLQQAGYRRQLAEALFFGIMEFAYTAVE